VGLRRRSRPPCRWGCATRDRRGELEQPPRLQRVPGVQDAAANLRLVTLRQIPPWCSRASLRAALEAAARATGSSSDGDFSAGNDGNDGADDKDDKDGDAAASAAAKAEAAAASPPLVAQLFVSDAGRGRGKAYHASAWVLYATPEAAARAAPRAGTAVAALAAGVAPPPGMGFQPAASLVAAAGLAAVGKPLDGLEVTSLLSLLLLFC
jgi:hypothetical protein